MLPIQGLLAFIDQEIKRRANSAMEHTLELSDFTFKLLLLFFPGILCAYMVDQLTIHRPRETFFFLLQSFVFGIFSYFTYWMGLKCINYFSPNTVYTKLTFLQALTAPNIVFSYKEIVITSIIAIILGGIVSVASKYKALNKIAHSIHITRKFGELDVWGYMLNLKEVVWVTVRDHKEDLMYDGWIQSFSDDSKDAELLLRDVSVYNNTSGDRLYQTSLVYLSRKREDISIECRTIPIDENVLWKEVKTNDGVKTAATAETSK